MVTARTPQEQLVLDFFRILSTGELEAIRATLHPDATWQPMVEGVPGAGTHGPRDKIVDEFLAPVRGSVHARRSEDHGRPDRVERRHGDVRVARQGARCGTAGRTTIATRGAST